MTKRGLMLVPLVGLVGVMQLLYFWLMNDSPCANVVYVFITLVSVANAGVGGWLCFTKDIRRTMPLLLTGTFFVVGTGIIGGVLLCSNAAVRTAGFSLSIVTLIYAVIETMLIFTLEPDDAIDGIVGRNDDDDYGPDEEDEYEELEQVEYHSNKERGQTNSMTNGSTRPRVQQPRSQYSQPQNYSSMPSMPQPQGYAQMPSASQPHGYSQTNGFVQMPSNSQVSGRGRVQTAPEINVNRGASRMPQVHAQATRVQRPMP